MAEELGSGADSLEKEFKALETGDTADERLLALKQKMGLLPPAEAAPPSRLEAPESPTRQITGGSGKPSVQEAELLEEFEELEKGEAGAGN